MSEDRLSVQRIIQAEPGAILRLLCDPAGYVAIDSTGMLMAAEGEAVTGVGDEFVVHMDREALNDYPLGHYDVTVRITTFEPDRAIAWTILGQFKPPFGHTYGYVLEPDAAGTRVTSYCDWSAIDDAWKDSGIFPVLDDGALRATLGIPARTVAADGRTPLPASELAP